MTTFILINGEKQVGKSTFAKELCEQLDNNIGGVNSIARLSFMGPFEQMMLALASYTLNKELSYEDFKKAEIAGRLGRDWLIAFGNVARAVDEDSLIRIMLEHIKSHWTKRSIDYVIIENWGFESELHSLRYWAPLYSSPYTEVTIHLSARSSRDYNPGEQYDSDNRFSLQHLAGYINPSVTDVAQALVPDGSFYAGIDDTQFDPFTMQALKDSGARLYAEIDRIAHKAESVPS